MKKALCFCLFSLIAAGIAVGQGLPFPRPNLIGRWKVIESWDIARNEKIEIQRTDALQGFDTIWIFKDDQELQMIDPLHMVDPVRRTYVYHWRWLNDTTVSVVPGSGNLSLLCHLLDYSKSRLVFISSVSGGDPNRESPSLYVLRVMQRTE